jgi:hypothetical protein
MDMAHMLAVHSDVLTPKAIAALEANIEERITKDLPTYPFAGENDNMTLMAQASMAMWARHTGDEAFNRIVHQRLTEFAAVLRRRGFQTEYGTTSYTAMQTHPTAMIAEYASDPSVRELALDIEARLWINLLCQFHSPSAFHAGPGARGCGFEQSMHTHALIAWALGDGFAKDFKGSMRVTEPGSDRFTLEFERGSHNRRVVEMASVPYHCPAWLAEWALNRTYPFEVLATADGCPNCEPEIPEGDSRPGHALRKGKLKESDDLYEYPCWDTRINVFMTEDYSLGTTKRPFSHGRQCEPFFVTFVDEKPVTHAGQSGRVRARYIVDEALHRKDKALLDRDALRRETKAHALSREGRCLCLQHQRTAMVLYHPRVNAVRNATSLKVLVMVSNRSFGDGACRGDEIYLGDTQVRDHVGESAEPLPVHVRMGQTYMALIPLILPHKALPVETPCAVRIRPEGRTLGISFYNHEGGPLTLDRRQCTVLGNGFVCEMGSAEEDGSFDDFRSRLADFEVTDRHGSGINTRGAIKRQTRYRRAGLELAMEYNPASEGIRYQTINGKIAPEPQLEATDLPLERVPLL